MSRRSTFFHVAAVLAVVAAAGCESVDLKTAVQLTDVTTGFYDNGLAANGYNHLVPSVTFSVRNTSDGELSSVDVIVMYWAAGQDTEQDESLVKVIGGAGLPPGATSDPVVSRSKVGFTLEQPRAELFTHPRFVDWTAKLFFKRGGKIVPAGEYPIERRILLKVPAGPAAE